MSNLNNDITEQNELMIRNVFLIIVSNKKLLVLLQFYGK